MANAKPMAKAKKSPKGKAKTETAKVLARQEPTLKAGDEATYLGGSGAEWLKKGTVVKVTKVHGLKRSFHYHILDPRTKTRTILSAKYLAT